MFWFSWGDNVPVIHIGVGGASCHFRPWEVQTSRKGPGTLSLDLGSHVGGAARVVPLALEPGASAVQ